MHGNLPIDVQNLDNPAVCGVVYVIISCEYPILYVGISNKGLRTGVFGAQGRFIHHARKLFAAPGAQTHHPNGWRSHAGTRYDDAVLRGQLSFDDLRIAFAADSSAVDHEGTVLDIFVPLVAQRLGSTEVLNSGAIRRQPVLIQLPPNVTNPCGQGTVSARQMPPTESTGAPARGVDAHTDDGRRDAEESLPIQPAQEGERRIAEAESELEEGETYERDLGTVEGYAEYLDAMTPQCQERFRQLLRWARSRRVEGRVSEAVIGGYTKQPVGYNGIQVLLFAELGPSGRALPRKWVCRIPLKCSNDGPMTIILPERSRKPGVREDLIVRGLDPNFRPSNLDDFLARPNYYTSFL